jgi:SNF family Na+-dependent transporter
MSSNRNMETRSLLDELRSFETGGFLDLGHPLLNRMADSFVKAAGVTFYSLSLSLSLSLSIYIYIKETQQVLKGSAAAASYTDRSYSGCVAGGLFYSH